MAQLYTKKSFFETKLAFPGIPGMEVCVKEPDHLETESAEMCYLYGRRTRLTSGWDRARVGSGEPSRGLHVFPLLWRIFPETIDLPLGELYN